MVLLNMTKDMNFISEFLYAHFCWKAVKNNQENLIVLSRLMINKNGKRRKSWHQRDIFFVEIQKARLTSSIDFFEKYFKVEILSFLLRFNAGL